LAPCTAPTSTLAGNNTLGEGRIAGDETIAYSGDSSGKRKVTLMVQVPDSFDPTKPCIVTATSSGSRGVYGAICTGEWGLKRGCAVAYTDKGTGSAAHDLRTDTVPRIDGTRTAAGSAAGQAAFDAGLTAAELAAFNAATPDRLAFKHAHSGRNPEKDWGRHTLQAVRLALYVLNERYGELDASGRRRVRLHTGNTLVIASSVSNGGGAALAAAEDDREGLIDGVAVAEPAIEMPANAGVAVQRGASQVPVIGRNLIDFTSYANLKRACAALAPALRSPASSAPFQALKMPTRSASIWSPGLIDTRIWACAGSSSRPSATPNAWWQSVRQEGKHAMTNPPESVTGYLLFHFLRVQSPVQGVRRRLKVARPGKTTPGPRCGSWRWLPDRRATSPSRQTSVPRRP